MKHFFAYIRVSTVKQGERGSSLQEQRSAIEGYAHRQDLTISQWFEEKETAAKRGRRLFSRMLAALEAGEADGVIMHKIDRSARNLRDWSDLGELIDRGIAVHFAHESVDLNSRGGHLSADIQAVVAADYIRNLRDEVRKGFFGRLKQGLYPLPAPIGYLDRGRGLPKEPDPMRAPLIRAAFELYATGAFNLDELGERMYKRGLRNKGGKGVSRNGFSRLLNNPFYMGLIQIHKTGQLFQGVHPPLVSKELFDRVQAVLDGRAAHHGIRHQFLFQRLLRCQHCGYRLIGERQKGHTYYRCHTKACPKTCLREETIEEIILDLLGTLPLDQDETESIKILALTLRSEWAVRREDERTAAKLSLARADERLARLTDALLDGLIDQELFETRKRALLLERKTLRDHHDGLSSDQGSSPTKLIEFLELAKRAPLSYRLGNVYEKRDVLKSVTSNLVADQQNVVVKLQKPFEALADRGKNNAGEPYRYGPRTGWVKKLTDQMPAIEALLDQNKANKLGKPSQNIIEFNKKREEGRGGLDQAA